MLDFSSALYLGLKHPATALPSWESLSFGVPAALASSPAASQVESSFARLTATEDAIAYPSSLHLFLDVCSLSFAHAFFVDSAVYPVALWALQNARVRNALVVGFKHFDPADLRRALDRHPSVSPIIISDGFCPSCGRGAPLRQYQRLATVRGGLVVVDDTQAVGVLGQDASSCNPLGRGGAGSAAHQALSADGLVVAASLAKGLGVPLAVLGGPRWFIGRVRAESLVRVHCSPPSEPLLLAGLRALGLNAVAGDALRRRLLANTRHVRARLAESGIIPLGGPFPVQMIQPCAPGAVYQELRCSDIRTVLLRRRCVGDLALAAIVTAAHSIDELERAVDGIVRAVSRRRPTKLRGPSGGHGDQGRFVRRAKHISACRKASGVGPQLW